MKYTHKDTDHYICGLLRNKLNRRIAVKSLSGSGERSFLTSQHSCSLRLAQPSLPLRPDEGHPLSAAYPGKSLMCYISVIHMYDLNSLAMLNDYCCLRRRESGSLFFSFLASFLGVLGVRCLILYVLNAGAWKKLALSKPSRIHYSVHLRGFPESDEPSQL